MSRWRLRRRTHRWGREKRQSSRLPWLFAFSLAWAKPFKRWAPLTHEHRSTMKDWYLIALSKCKEASLSLCSPAKDTWNKSPGRFYCRPAAAAESQHLGVTRSGSGEGLVFVFFFFLSACIICGQWKTGMGLQSVFIKERKITLKCMRVNSQLVNQHPYEFRERKKKGMDFQFIFVPLTRKMEIWVNGLKN